MLIHIHIEAGEHFNTIIFDNQKSLSELFDHISASHPKKLAHSMIEAIERCVGRNGETPLEKTKLIDNIRIYGLPIDTVPDHSNAFDESSHQLPEPYTAELLALLSQKAPDLVSARKFLSQVKELTLNPADFTPTLLNRFWLAMHGNISLQKIHWTPNGTSRLHAIMDKISQHNQEISLRKNSNRLLDVTVNNPCKFQDIYFEYHNCQPMVYAEFITFKLRINLFANSYPELREPITEILTLLNRKYAFDDYTPPLQSFKSMLINEDFALAVRIYQILFSDKPNKESIAQKLVNQILDRKERNILKQSIDMSRYEGTTSELSIRFKNAQRRLKGYLRLTEQAQFTLYPNSDHNPCNIRLLFLIRDLEITLRELTIKSSAKLATTDASIGNYISFRQQLSTQGLYVSGSSDEAIIEELSALQLQSPHYLFLSNKTHAEFHIDPTREGVIALLQHYLGQNSDDEVINDSIQHLITRIIDLELTLSDILRALDAVLLTLHDSAHPIDLQLLEISYYLDKLLAKERAELVTAEIPPYLLDTIEELTQEDSIATLLASSLSKPGGIFASASDEEEASSDHACKINR